ncbi:MAG: hypothetical protein JST00_38460 [Deltaproteobacteria bacterium]|nr:hypothetical protein [Deltaproteobacteria bacterium]
MTKRKTIARTTGLLIALGVAGATVAAACGGGDDGAPGAAGAQGVPGPQGPVGPAGEAGAPAPDGGGVLSGACTLPCHTFGGVVDQWRFSNHSHPQNNEIGGGSCGNCHAIDGLQQRVANKYVVLPDSGAPVGVANGHISYKAANGAVQEIGYGGATTIGRIHCTTCHDFNPTNDPHVTGKYVAGQAPLRVKSGPTDLATFEKTASGTDPVGQSVSYKTANTCVFCHKSRKDISAYITASNTISSYRWGPHDGPQTDVYSGKGGYHFTGKTYGTSAHAAIANACVSCHMQPVAGNSNVPDHTMKPTVAYCKTCHTAYTGTNFDVQGGRTLVKNALAELEAALDAKGLLTRSESAPFAPLAEDQLGDGQFHLDLARPGSAPGGGNQTLDAETAGALYNYLILARSKDLGVHNPTYAKQLLWDSIEKVTGAVPTTLPSRPN